MSARKSFILMRLHRAGRSARRGGMHGTRSRQGGFTLIELMISLLVAAILVAMAFSVYTQLSVAYRAQTQVSELQQTLRTAKMHIAKHVRAAGHLIPNGFETLDVANNPVTVQPLAINNNDVPAEATFSPDSIRVFYADSAAIAVVQGPAVVSNYVEVDDSDDFLLGELVFIVNPKLPQTTVAGQAPIIEYDACLVKITNIAVGTPDIIHFDSSGSPFNTDNNTQCTNATDQNRSPVMYRAMARAFRLAPDLADRQKGLLQMSPTGGLVADDWQLMGVGFTNMQFAVRYFEDGDITDRDLDTDPQRDWYSGINAPPLGAVPIEVTMSLEVRTIHDLDVVATGATPSFVEAGQDVDHNRIGDWASVPLAGVPDGARPEQYRGNRIYRWSTSRLDVRNLGVGR